MLEGISPSLVQGGAVALLGLMFITLFGAVWKGLLITKPELDRLMTIQEGRVKAAEDREARTQKLAETWQQTAREAIASNEANIEQSKTILAVLESLRRNNQRR